MWSEQGNGRQHVTSGAPGPWNSSAAALLAYDIPHRAPWDWRVGLYTWTKSIAAGAYLAALLLAVAGLISWSSSLWLWAAPLVAGAFLGATGAILIWDLEHPLRFPLIFLRPQWRSWLVRGAFVIAGYSAVLGLQVLLGLVGLEEPQRWLALAGGPLAAMTAAYTGYLFAQAKARDLWQSPLLPPHLVVQAFLAGSAVLLPFAAWLDDDAGDPLSWMLGIAALVHLLALFGEVTLTHQTAHAHLAVHELVRGRYARFFWAGVVLVGVALAAPWIGVAAVPFALAGLLAYEHAHVQAGQAAPLA
jgi:formate-dependent nitrite reductase membrane component NrfD